MTKSFSSKIFKTEAFSKLKDKTLFITLCFQFYLENKRLINSFYEAYNGDIEVGEAERLQFYLNKSVELLKRPELASLFAIDVKSKVV